MDRIPVCSTHRNDVPWHLGNSINLQNFQVMDQHLFSAPSYPERIITTVRAVHKFDTREEAIAWLASKPADKTQEEA